jgi:hypothetical protein
MSEPSSAPTTERAKKAPPRSPWVSQDTRAAFLDVEWGEERYLQIQYVGITDLLYKDHTIRIVCPRYQVTIKLDPPPDKPFNLSKFRKDFQMGVVASIQHRPDLGFSVRVDEITEDGLRSI